MNIIDGCIVKEKLAMVSPKKAHELTRYTLQKNDILIARRGDLSKCAIVNEQSSGWLCGTGSFFLHVPFVEPQYIMLFYLSEYVQTILKRECVGATMENLNQGVLGSIPLLLPPIKEQKRIIQKIKTLETIVFNIESGSQEIRRLTSQVKSKILEHAISGKLVPQDPADEPAADLLKRINPNAVVSADTSHYKFDIPNDWIISQLGNLFNHNTGKALNRSNQEGTMLDYITTSNLYWDRFELNNLKQMPFKESEIDKCTVIKGDLLVCEGGDIGRAAIWNKEQPIQYQNALHRVRFNDEVLPRFCLMYLRCLKEKGILDGRYGKGVTIKHLVKSSLLSIPIPVPPIAEQERIVAELDLLQGIIEKKKEQLKAYDQLAQSIFYTMFGDPIDNPKGWETKKLGEVATQKLSYGSGASAIQYNGKIRYVRITDIREDGELNSDIVSPDTFDEKYLLNEGDILFARSGATVGKTFQYKSRFGKCIFAGYLIRMIPNIEIVLPSFIFAYTKSSYYRSFVSKAQNAVAQPNINAKQYSDLLVPVPPLSLQQEFAEKVEAIERQKALVQQSIDETQTMFDYTMDKYFG